MPPDELGHECHIRISNLSSFSDVLEPIVKRNLLGENHVAKNHGSRSGDALDAMHVDSTAFVLGSVDKLDDLVEAALNVLSDVIFEVEGEVLDALGLVVVATVVGSTIDNMRNPILTQLFIILSHNVGSKINKVVKNH